MTLEKGIRSCFPKPENEGFSAPSTLGYNPDVACLDTSLRKGKSVFSLVSSFKKPETLSLRVFLNSLPMTQKHTQAQMIKADRIYEPTLFYDPRTVDENSHLIAQNTVEAIEIRYAGSGTCDLEGKSRPFKDVMFPDFKLQFTSKDLLYRHEFKTQSRELLRETRTPLSSSLVLTHLTGWSSGRVNVCPLLAYGGYYRPGLSLYEIGQSFGRLSSTEHQYTSLVLKTFHQWKEKGVMPPEGKRLQGRLYFFNDSLNAQDFWSLESFIREGSVEMTLEKEGLTFPYISSDYRQKDPQNPTFDIIFIPKS